MRGGAASCRSRFVEMRMGIFDASRAALGAEETRAQIEERSVALEAPQ